MLLLPHGYCGAVQLRTRKGNLTFLPALTSIMRVVNATEREALILIGDTSTFSESEVFPAADYCQLVTRRGKITVGLSGKDNYIPETGFWKRLGELFLGGAKSHCT